MKENELIELLLQRNDGALALLELHYGPLIRYIISPILSDPRDRDEVFSDVLLRVWDRIGQFNPDHGSLANRLSVISRNAAIDRLRRATPAAGEMTDDLASHASNPELVLLQRERREMLLRAIRMLTGDEQTLFYRKYYYRQSTLQIAAEYGTTERAIEGKLYRIRKRLRRQLGGELFDE